MLLFLFVDIVEFSRYFNSQIKRLTTVIYNYQHKEKKEPINDPDLFEEMLKEKDPSLDGFFNMLFQSMDPANKNSNTKKSLRLKVMMLCYQLAGLRNKQFSLVKNKIASHMVNTGTSSSGLDTLANIGISSTYKTAVREKTKNLESHQMRLIKYLKQMYVLFIIIIIIIINFIIYILFYIKSFNIINLYKRFLYGFQNHQKYITKKVSLLAKEHI